MKIDRCGLALVLVVLLAACGGGDADTSAPVPLRAANASATSTTPESAANQLLETAEATYPLLFPTHPATQWALPFHYRYYASTGIHLAVVVAAGSAYPLGGIYAAGGPFGTLENPTYLGLVSERITLGAQANRDRGNGCNNFALDDTEGTHIVVESKSIHWGIDSVETSVTTQDWKVGGLTMFAGHELRETTYSYRRQRTGDAASSSTTRFYGQRTGDAESTTYGYEVVAPSPEVMVYSTPRVDKRFSLAVGESLTASDGVITTFAGYEMLISPAGTFMTCKFEEAHPANPHPMVVGKFSYWILYGRGIKVKTMLAGFLSPFQTDATSITVNGRRL